ncbi:DUF922 domain-containing protein [Winogradskyella bathintestinalis]|uniref:DUF922 domain-containing protein n=1 Tax=Winogradskyella bathintestinalis TaxID=3035208 RepID=A0ABT7ZU00_9FLAO|nr:DUF922 domain-containing protein [Winogradskyella bathintestinalis]MDN3492483.1 DUF922 domain-containing protein [Winogradskyella bathintestinalis]
MKNLILFIAFIFFGNITNDQVMIWNETSKLTWADFKAHPDTESDAVALTASGITFGYSLKTSGDKIVDFSTNVEAHFYPDKSWYVKERGNAHILAHEQLHFDITELYARQFRQKLTKLKVNQNLKAQLNQLQVSINEAITETQQRYDKETNHSMVIDKQKKWEAFIAIELNNLAQYKS